MTTADVNCPHCGARLGFGHLPENCARAPETPETLAAAEALARMRDRESRKEPSDEAQSASIGERVDFTAQEFNFIFGVLSGLPNKEIAQRYEMAQDTVQHATCSVYDKAGVCTRLELIEFVKTALNGELRRRHGEKS
jgi:DNA-binding NarL/FixJ family response regulator